MYREQEKVLVKRMTWDTSAQRFHERWVPGVVVACLGEIRIRTGIARFELLVAYNVHVDGTVEKVSERNLKKSHTGRA